MFQQKIYPPPPQLCTSCSWKSKELWSVGKQWAGVYEQTCCCSKALTNSNLSSNFWQRYLVVNRETSNEMASLTAGQMEHDKPYVRTKDIFYNFSKSGESLDHLMVTIARSLKSKPSQYFSRMMKSCNSPKIILF